jgi:hypothetical protein
MIPPKNPRQFLAQGAANEALPVASPYAFNEGQLTLRVTQERTLHMLTLAQDDGPDLTLSLSRGVKEPDETLSECLLKQLESVAEDAVDFHQLALQEFRLSPSAPTAFEPVCLTTEVSYKLGEMLVQQCVALIQLSDHYLLFVTLTQPLGLSDASRREWHRILASFVPRDVALPEPGDDLFGRYDEDEE